MSTSFFSRLKMATRLLFGNQELPAALPAPAPEPAEASATLATPLVSANTEGALQLLALLQQESRLIDFVQEEITAFDDAQVGAAARVVHQGLRKALEEHLTLVPVSNDQEGDRVTLPAGFDARTWRLSGNIQGDGPFSGTLIHKGWQASEIHLPQTVAGYNFAILAPAEVEL